MRRLLVAPIGTTPQFEYVDSDHDLQHVSLVPTIIQAEGEGSDEGGELELEDSSEQEDDSDTGESGSGATGATGSGTSPTTGPSTRGGGGELLEAYGVWCDNAGEVTTVCVYNLGSGDVYVQGGGGVANVSPASGSDFSVSVEGEDGYVGDGYWTGDAASLNFSATGSVGPISISGYLNVSAEFDIGDLSSQHLSAESAQGSIGNVNTSGEIFLVDAQGGSVGND